MRQPDQSFEGPVRFRARGFLPRASMLGGAATLIGLLLIWQAAAMAGVISTRFLPPPAAIAAALGRLVVTGVLWQQLGPSLGRLAIGWTLGTVTGIAAGCAIGLLSVARSPGLAIVSALFPIPKIALVPLFIIWFGIGEGSKLVTLGFGVFFPTALGTAAAIDAVPRNLIRMAQSFGVPPLSIIRHVVLPGALPGLLATARLTTSIAITLLVAAEMIGAERGIGAFVLSAGNLYDTENLMAGIVMLSILGLLIAFVIGRLERALLAWR